jgi:hypothetical protein
MTQEQEGTMTHSNAAHTSKEAVDERNSKEILKKNSEDNHNKNYINECLSTVKPSASPSELSLPLSFEIDLDPSSLEMLREKYCGFPSKTTSNQDSTIKVKNGELRSVSDTVSGMDQIILMLEVQKRAIERLEAKVDRLLVMDHNMQKRTEGPGGTFFRGIHNRITHTVQDMWIIRAIRTIYVKAQQERILQRIDVWMFIKWMAAATFLAIRMQSRMTVKKTVTHWDKYRIPTMFVAVIVFFCIQSGLLHFLYRIIRELPTWMKNTPPTQPVTDTAAINASTATANNDNEQILNNEELTAAAPPAPALNRGGVIYELFYLITGFFFSLMPAWQPQRDGDGGGGGVISEAQQQQHIAGAGEDEEEEEEEEEAVEEGVTDAHIAAAEGSLQDLERIAVSQPFSLSKKDINGWTPLHEAARSGSVDCVNFLVVTKGLDVNPRTAEGATPLYEANLVHAAQHPVIRLLKRLGGLDIGPSSTTSSSSSSEEQSDDEEDEVVEDILM